MDFRDVLSIAFASKLIINSAFGAELPSNDQAALDYREAISFDIEASKAEKSLPQFLAQVDLPVIYILNEIKGIKLNAVQGAFPPAEALLRLMDDTGLAVEIDENSGIWLIKNKTSTESGASPSAETVTTASASM